VEAVPFHPVKEIFTEHWSLHYGRHNLNKTPIANKIYEFVQTMEEDIELKIWPKSPPWHQKNIFIDLALTTEINKTNTNPEEAFLIAKEYMQIFQNTLHIYTDGSKTQEGKVGYGIFIPKLNIEKSIRTSNKLSIFTAEMLAIKDTLIWVKLNISQINQPITIFTDSKSSLEAIKSTKTKNTTNVAKDIKSLLNDINKMIILVWIPSHTNIKGNEKADSLAKAATKKKTIDLKVNYTYSEILPQIKDYINKKWQNQYRATKTKGHYKKIQPKISRRIKYSNKFRRLEVAITRLRLGKCNLNKYLNDYKIIESPLCTKCGLKEDITHFLMECKAHEIPQLLKNTAKKYNIPLNIPNILSRDILLNIITNNLKRHI